MIDLDGFCLANPARDVGNFLAYLCWKAIRQPEHATFVECAGQAFLNGYLEAGGDLDDRWLDLYQAASLLKIAGRRFRSLTFIEWPLVKHLIDAALAVIKFDQDSGSNLIGGDPSEHKFLHLTTSTNKTKFPAVFIDAEFPALWLALNAEMMDENIAPLFLTPGCKEHHPELGYAKLLAYKPGKRGVIRYEFNQHSCIESRAVLGKLYPEPYLAERAYKVMKILWEDVFYKSPSLGVSEPLGFIPELSMLVFFPSEGQVLGDAISSHPTFNAEVTHMMEQAGEWLATLHQHRIALEKQFQIVSEYDNIRDWANIISTKYPQEAEAVWRIASYLLDRGENLHFDTHVPIHKDFHYEHIMVNNCLTVFDFDEMRLGDPNLDLAHFCANFYLLAYRKNKRPAEFVKLQNRFLDSYTQFTGWTLDERFNYFYTYTCLKIAKQLCKLRGPRPWPEGEEQHAQVWLMLEQALLVMSQATNMIEIEKTSLPIVDFSTDRRTSWLKAHQISKSATSSEAIHVSHKLLS
jgi:Ser/Thr protein kinase RdoA (MazF antagonist)